MDLDREKVLEWIDENKMCMHVCKDTSYFMVRANLLKDAITNGDFDKEDSK